MEKEKTQGLSRGVLRSLFYAHGQMINSQRRVQLFCTADMLSRIVHGPESEEIARECPGAKDLVEELEPVLKGDVYKHNAMMNHKINGFNERIAEELFQIACYYHGRAYATGRDEDEYVVSKPTRAALQLIMMGDNVRIKKPSSHNKRYITQSNPFISARFVGEYAKMLADDFDNEDKKDEMNKIADRLITLAGRYNFQMESISNDKITDMMTELADASDRFLEIFDNLDKHGLGGTKTETGLDYLFQHAALYDWKQFETGDTPSLKPEKLIPISPPLAATQP